MFSETSAYDLFTWYKPHSTCITHGWQILIITSLNTHFFFQQFMSKTSNLCTRQGILNPWSPAIITVTSYWRDGVSNHQPDDCSLNRSFGCRSKKTSKLRVIGLCVGIHRSPVNSPNKWPLTRKCCHSISSSWMNQLTINGKCAYVSVIDSLENLLAK